MRPFTSFLEFYYATREWNTPVSVIYQATDMFWPMRITVTPSSANRFEFLDLIAPKVMVAGQNNY